MDTFIANFFVRLPFVFIVYSMAINVCVSQPVFFSERTELLQYVTGTMGQAKCVIDLDGDGRDDVVRFSDRGLHADVQLANGGFSYIFIPHAFNVLPSWSVCAGDLDNDGLADFMLGGIGETSFLFTDIHDKKVHELVMPDFVISQRSNFVDLNNDVFLDAFLCNDAGRSIPFRNLGNRQMVTDNTLIETSSLPGNYSSVWTDFNNDHLPDVYISKCLPEAQPGNPVRTNLLYKNLGGQQYIEIGKAAGLDDNAQSWTTLFEDFDNDGDMDALVLNHDEQNRLYRNNGDETFTDVIDISGIDKTDIGAFEGFAGDFNNDGRLDILSGLKKELYLGNGDLTFEGSDMPFTLGAVGDLNSDGFLDVTTRSQLWINNGNKNHWVKFQLKGWESNRDGIGATIKLFAKNGVQTRERRAGEGYSSMHSLHVHFGLGDVSIIDSVHIYWPSGNFTKIVGLQADSLYSVVEGRCALSTSVDLKPMNIPLCPDETIQLEIQPGFADYVWSNGSRDSLLQITTPGSFFLMARDSAGCSGILQRFVIRQADIKPDISYLSGDGRYCTGEITGLTAENGERLHWSTGELNKDSIFLEKSGDFFGYKVAECFEGYIFSDTLAFEFFASSPPSLKNIERIGNDSVYVELNGENCRWFWHINDTIPFYQGCTLTLPETGNATTYFADDVVSVPFEPVYGGKLDTSGFFTTINALKHLHFTVHNPFELISVDMFVKNETSKGTRNIFILDSRSDTIYTISVDLKKGRNEVFLRIVLAPGQYRLTCDRSDQMLNIGPLDFPYPIYGLGTVDSSSTGLAFYPYFFNWKVRPLDKVCYSEKVPVTINISGFSTNGQKDKMLEIYPNPTSDFLIVRFHKNVRALSYKLYRFDGMSLLSQGINNENEWTVDVHDLLPGCYLISVNTDEGIFSKSFVIY